MMISAEASNYPSGEFYFETGGYGDDNGYSSPKMDAIIKQSTEEPGLTGLYAFEDFASEQQPVIFLPNIEYSLMIRKGLHGVGDFTSPLGDWAPEKLYCTAP